MEPYWREQPHSGAVEFRGSSNSTRAAAAPVAVAAAAAPVSTAYTCAAASLPASRPWAQHDSSTGMPSHIRPPWKQQQQYYPSQQQQQQQFLSQEQQQHELLQQQQPIRRARLQAVSYGAPQEAVSSPAAFGSHADYCNDSYGYAQQQQQQSFEEEDNEYSRSRYTRRRSSSNGSNGRPPRYSRNPPRRAAAVLRGNSSSSSNGRVVLPAVYGSDTERRDYRHEAAAASRRPYPGPSDLRDREHSRQQQQQQQQHQHVKPWYGARSRSCSRGRTGGSAAAFAGPHSAGRQQARSPGGGERVSANYHPSLVGQRPRDLQARERREWAERDSSREQEPLRPRGNACAPYNSSASAGTAAAAATASKLHASGGCYPCIFYLVGRCRHEAACRSCHDPSHGDPSSSRFAPAVLHHQGSCTACSLYVSGRGGGCRDRSEAHHLLYCHHPSHRRPSLACAAAPAAGTAPARASYGNHPAAAAAAAAAPAAAAQSGGSGYCSRRLPQQQPSFSLPQSEHVQQQQRQQQQRQQQPLQRQPLRQQEQQQQQHPLKQQHIPEQEVQQQVQQQQHPASCLPCIWYFCHPFGCSRGNACSRCHNEAHRDPASPLHPFVLLHERKACVPCRRANSSAGCVHRYCVFCHHPDHLDKAHKTSAAAAAAGGEDASTAAVAQQQQQQERVPPRQRGSCDPGAHERGVCRPCAAFFCSPEGCKASGSLEGTGRETVLSCRGCHHAAHANPHFLSHPAVSLHLKRFCEPCMRFLKGECDRAPHLCPQCHHPSHKQSHLQRQQQERQQQAQQGQAQIQQQLDQEQQQQQEEEEEEVQLDGDCQWDVVTEGGVGDVAVCTPENDQLPQQQLEDEEMQQQVLQQQQHELLQQQQQELLQEQQQEILLQEQQELQQQQRELLQEQQQQLLQEQQQELLQQQQQQDLLQEQQQELQQQEEQQQQQNLEEAGVAAGEQPQQQGAARDAAEEAAAASMAAAAAIAPVAAAAAQAAVGAAAFAAAAPTAAADTAAPAAAQTVG